MLEVIEQRSAFGGNVKNIHYRNEYVYGVRGNSQIDADYLTAHTLMKIETPEGFFSSLAVQWPEMAAMCKVSMTERQQKVVSIMEEHQRHLARETAMNAERMRGQRMREVAFGEKSEDAAQAYFDGLAKCISF